MCYFVGTMSIDCEQLITSRLISVIIGSQNKWFTNKYIYTMYNKNYTFVFFYNQVFHFSSEYDEYYICT